MRGVVIVATALFAVILAGCASMEVAQFEPHAGQQTMVRDGVPVVYSRQRNSLALLRPALRQFRSGNRPVYVLALYNLTNAPLQFVLANVGVAQEEPNGQVRPLRVYTYDELVSEERRRQAVRALAVGLAAAGNSISAASAGNYNGTAVVNTPRGTAFVNYQGYDPTAAAVAQDRAAAQNEAMIANVVETGQRNLATLEQTVIKDDTLLPGEWYGGQLQFDAPDGRGPKTYSITVPVGGDTHQFVVLQAPAAQG
jgi:hypothetical protein